MPDHNAEDEALAAWCEVLGHIHEVPVTITARPDREPSGRGGCDAIVRVGDVEVAVEHTSVDAYEGQRADHVAFRKVMAPLEAEIRDRFPDSFILVYVYASSIPIGTSWDDLLGVLRTG